MAKKPDVDDPFKLAAAVRLSDPGMPDEDVDLGDSQDQDPRAAGRERYDRKRTGELDFLVPSRRCSLCRRKRLRSGQWVVFDVLPNAPKWLMSIARETPQAGCMRAAVCRTCNLLDARVREARGKQ